jgi:two-component system OmpR family response regulator
VNCWRGCALLRRQDKLRAQVASELRFDGWRLLPDQRRLLAPDGRAGAQRGEFVLLLALAERPGGCWGASSCCREPRRSQRQRRPCCRPGDQPPAPQAGQAASGAEALVQTLRGEGYRFDAEVQVL